jgi:hypothetical protein
LCCNQRFSSASNTMAQRSRSRREAIAESAVLVLFRSVCLRTFCRLKVLGIRF